MKPRRARQGDPLLAIGYLRVSTDDQKLGPEAQRASIEAWAKRVGITVVAWHCDQGVSGGADLVDRPGLVAALGELRAVRAGVLLVAKRDRLARDVYIALTIERAVQACGAHVAAADGTGNGEGAADAFMRTILDAAAAYERALIRARTKAALQAKRARGERAGEVPFGFRLGPDRQSLQPDPAEVHTITRVTDLRLQGLSVRGITARLASEGIVSRSGKPLGSTQVHRLLPA